jgi:hypothetical protein
MIFQRINRSNPERVFIVIKNGYATASLTNGQSVIWDSGDADGVNVTRIGDSKSTQAFAGVIAETIAAGEYGLMQVYGYHSAVIVDSNTTVDIAALSPLFAITSGFHLEGPWLATGTTEELSIFQITIAAVALEAYGSVGTTGSIKAIVKAL